MDAGEKAQENKERRRGEGRRAATKVALPLAILLTEMTTVP